MPMNYDLHLVSFSTAGSTLVVRITQPPKDRSNGLHLRVVSVDLLGLSMVREGTAVEWDHQADPTRLMLRPRCGAGEIEFVFETADILRIRTSGVALRMQVQSEAWAQVVPRGSDRWQINHYGVRQQILLSRVSGEVTVDAPWDGVRASQVTVTISGEIALSCLTSTAPTDAKRPTLMPCRQRVRRDWTAFMRTLPSVPARYASARELAGYILWSARVDPQGRYRRPAVLMSKNRMSAVWSWDHCFNAMALAPGQAALAWDQMLLPFDHQDEHGALPDSIGIDSLGWNFCKPPIHGWALRKMLALNGNSPSRRHIASFYPQLAAWTNWWLRSRDDDGDGLCQYHHGNDSGWDNATCFTMDMPIESPDLAAFLVVQLDVLSSLAERLAKPAEARRWKRRADRMLSDLIRHNWRDDRFAVVQSGSHRVAAGGDSLLPFLPLVLGKRLPPAISRRLVDDLFQPGRFLTEHGLATESPKSPRYEADGYWRGPIWAPSTFLIYDGLRQLGEHARAQDLARRFCDLCRSGGMAENFNALTGEALRDKAYTWTASVFLMLAHDLRGVR